MSVVRLNLSSLSLRLLTQLSKLEAMSWKLSMNLRSPILNVMIVFRIGDPVYLAVAYLAVNFKGSLDDRMTGVAPENMHDNG